MDKRLIKEGQKVAWFTIVINLLLALIKFIAGIYYKSGALMADGFHSASDVLSTFVVLVTMKISSRPADENHPYGHGKAEDIGTKILGLLLLLTSLIIVRDNLIEIINRTNQVIAGSGALLVALTSIVVKEWMFRYTIAEGKRLKSRPLIADAWHHRTDALSSVAALAGLGGALLGFKILDPLAGIVVGLMIGYKAYEILLEAIQNLMDTTPDELVEKITEYVENFCVVEELRDIRYRKYGWKGYLDITIAVSERLSVIEGHEIASFLEEKITEKFEEIMGVFVHIEPRKGEEDQI